MASRTKGYPFCAWPGPQVSSTSWCLMFGDRVTDSLCLLRRKELGRSESFTCEGCERDSMLRQERAVWPGSKTL